MEYHGAAQRMLTADFISGWGEGTNFVFVINFQSSRKNVYEARQVDIGIGYIQIKFEVCRRYTLGSPGEDYKNRVMEEFLAWGGSKHQRS